LPAFSFWIKFSQAILYVTYTFSNFAKYPLSIYAPWIRHFITFLIPFAFTAFIPASWFLQDNTLLWALGGTALAAAGSAALALFTWKQGYQSLRKLRELKIFFHFSDLLITILTGFISKQDKIMQRKGFLSLWLLAGFLLPPVIWLGMGLYIELWSWEEILRFLIDPPFLMWIYILFFVGFTYWLFQNELKKIEGYQGDPSSLSKAQKGIHRLPFIFLGMMTIYCVLGPFVVMIPQSLHQPFLDGTEYWLARILGDTP
jgi:hypothetical protein